MQTSPPPARLILTILLLSLFLLLSGTGLLAAEENALPMMKTSQNIFEVPAEPVAREATGLDRGRYKILIDSQTISDTLQKKGLIDLHIEFSSGSARLTDNAYQLVQEIAWALQSPELQNKRILITGHTDWVGSAAANLKLSQQRAATVKKTLVRLGITQSRLATRGLGESKPIADNHTAAGRARNRRVTLSIITNQ